jgi:hypothetical protein
LHHHFENVLALAQALLHKPVEIYGSRRSLGYRGTQSADHCAALREHGLESRVVEARQIPIELFVVVLLHGVDKMKFFFETLAMNQIRMTMVR